MKIPTERFSTVSQRSFIAHGLAFVLFAFLGCSKSDTGRTAGSSDESGGIQTSSGEGDNSAFAPTDVAGSFLAAIIGCQKYVEDNYIKLSCSLIDRQSNRRVIPLMGKQVARVFWSVALDGVPKADSPENLSAKLFDLQALNEPVDHVFVLGPTDMEWPKIIAPKVAVTLTDGRKFENNTLRTESIKSLVTRPAGTSTRSSSNGDSGSRPPSGTATAFVTRDLFPSPDKIFTDASVTQHFATCSVYQSRKGIAYGSHQLMVRAAADTLCTCVAGLASLDVSATKYYAIANVEGSALGFAALMSTKQARPLYDMSGVLLAAAGGLFSLDPVTQTLATSLVHPITLDEFGNSVTSGANSQRAWTGITFSGLVTSGGAGLPDCNGWMPRGEGDIATAGQVGAHGPSAFEYMQGASCYDNRLHFYCASE